MDLKRLEVFFEFLIFGIVIGIAEDLLAIRFATEAKITWNVVGIVFLIAVPFAFLGEVLVDRVDFVSIFQRVFNRNNNFKNEPKI